MEARAVREAIAGPQGYIPRRVGLGPLAGGIKRQRAKSAGALRHGPLADDGAASAERTPEGGGGSQERIAPAAFGQPMVGFMAWVLSGRLLAAGRRLHAVPSRRFHGYLA